MKRHIASFIGLALVITAVSASAQMSHELRVTVPFSFIAGAKSSPAGDYRFQIDRSRDLVTLTSPDLRSTYLLTTRALLPNDGRSYLRFHRYGTEWFLEEVATGGVGQKLIRSKAERNMIAGASAPEGQPIIADLATH